MQQGPKTGIVAQRIQFRVLDEINEEAVCALVSRAIQCFKRFQVASARCNTASAEVAKICSQGPTQKRGLAYFRMALVGRTTIWRSSPSRVMRASASPRPR